jgi:uncharacterized protein YjbI with pentapeptide repeats
MRRSVLLWVAAGLIIGCKHDQPCRPGTVLVTFDFADARDRVDGLALQYSLDGSTVADLKPVNRPTDSSPASLEIEIAKYDAHSQLVLRVAPLLAGHTVGDWQVHPVPLSHGCTSLSIPVNSASVTDGGALDASGGDASGGDATGADATGADATGADTSGGDANGGDAGGAIDATDGSAGDAKEPNPICTLDQSNLDQCVLAE